MRFGSGLSPSCSCLRKDVPVVARFLVDFNGSARIRASPSCWVYAWTQVLHVKKVINKNCAESLKRRK